MTITPCSCGANEGPEYSDTNGFISICDDPVADQDLDLDPTGART